MSRWVVVHNAEDAVEAQAALDYLDAHAIAARLRPHPDPQLAGAPVSPGFGRIEVEPHLADEARSLMARWTEAPPEPVVERRTQTPRLAPESSPGLPRWAERTREPGWLWWALVLSVTANAVLGTLWWQAEERAQRPPHIEEP